VIELHATHTVSDREFVVTLDVRNGTEELVYVPVLPVDAEFEAYPNSAYVHLTTDELAVCLVLGPSLLPTESDVEVLMSAYHAALAPGGQLRHTLRFPLPLAEWYAYFRPVPEADPREPVLVYQVHVFMELVRSSNARVVEPAPGHETFFRLTPKSVDLLRQTITPDHPLPVLKSSDPEFPRL
jgi:hypothetical protein